MMPKKSLLTRLACVPLFAIPVVYIVYFIGPINGPLRRYVYLYYYYVSSSFVRIHNKLDATACVFLIIFEKQSYADYLRLQTRGQVLILSESILLFFLCTYLFYIYLIESTIID